MQVWKCFALQTAFSVIDLLSNWVIKQVKTEKVKLNGHVTQKRTETSSQKSTQQRKITQKVLKKCTQRRI